MKKLFLIFLAMFAMALSASAQSRTVTGTVVYDVDGEPLIGASVIAEGETNGVVTDIDGNFRIEVAPSVHNLVFTYVGMISQTVAIPADGKPMMIRLSDKENLLDEVMVVAYGTSTRASFTGSAAVVESAQIEDRLVSNITKALSGTVAGVQTLSSNGQPGTSATVRIRGIGSINASASPLYVLDGVPYDGDIAAVNTADIASVTVLKDAAAAALYGARGANGVILITTKKGKTGEAKVTVDARWGVNSRQIPDYDMIKDPRQWYEVAYQAQKNNALLHLGYSDAEAHAYANSMLQSFSGVSGYRIFTVPDGQYMIGNDGKFNPNATMGWSNGVNYFTPDNWEDETFRNGLRQEYNVNISGANDRFNYYVSFNYLKDEGVITNSAYERLAARTSLEYQVKPWMKVGTNMSYTNANSNYPGDQTSTASSGNAFFIATSIAPIYPIFVRDAQGNIMHDAATGHPIYDYGDGKSTAYTRQFMNMANPKGDLIYDTDDYLMDIFSGKWYVQLTPIEGLTVTGTASLHLDNTRNHFVRNSLYGQGVASGGEASQSQTRERGLNLQALANYKKSWGMNNFDFLLGYESYDWNYEMVSGYGQTLYVPGNWNVNNTLTANRSTSGSSYDYATRGIFGRINYDYDSRYFASVSYRRDASSCFHPDHRWGNFYSASVAWDMANEAFMEDMTWIDMLKLKVSYGEQGNDNLGRSASNPYYYYAYLDQYAIKGDTSWSDSQLVFKGNPEITWEKSKAFNVGVDYSLWSSKLAGSVEYFSRETSDMLYNKPVAASNGYSSIPMNVGSMRNSGVEIDINYTPISTRDITWDVNFNITFLQNKILKLSPDLNGEMIDGARIYREGESMYSLYLTPWAGVNAKSGEGEYWSYEPYKEKDPITGVEVTKYKTDEPLIRTSNYADAYNSNRQSYDMLPTCYGGINTSLQAYGFDLALGFGYQLGGQVIDYSYQYGMGSGTAAAYGHNWHKDILNAWTPTNTNTDVPRLDAGDANSFYSRLSSRSLVSSDYFSINNITLGYTIPAKITKGWGIESIRVYGSADNVAVFAARKGLDPRQSYLSSTSSTYGALRAISGGVKVVF